MVEESALERIYTMISNLKDTVEGYQRDMHARVSVVEKQMQEHSPPCPKLLDHLREHDESVKRINNVKDKALGTLIAIVVIIVCGAVIFAFARGYINHINITNSPTVTP